MSQVAKSDGCTGFRAKVGVTSSKAVMNIGICSSRMRPPHIYIKIYIMRIDYISLVENT